MAESYSNASCCSKRERDGVALREWVLDPLDRFNCLVWGDSRMDYVFGACLTRIGLQHWDETNKKRGVLVERSVRGGVGGSRTLTRALVLFAAPSIRLRPKRKETGGKE